VVVVERQGLLVLAEVLEHREVVVHPVLQEVLVQAVQLAHQEVVVHLVLQAQVVVAERQGLLVLAEVAELQVLVVLQEVRVQQEHQVLP